MWVHLYSYETGQVREAARGEGVWGCSAKRGCVLSVNLSVMTGFCQQLTHSREASILLVILLLWGT